MRDIITKLAVNRLCKQLKKHNDFWYAWQSNIAMTIFDNMTKYMPLRTNPDRILVERDEILGALARGYCSVTNSNKTVDPVLIEAMANEIMCLNTNMKDASPDPLNKDYSPTKNEFCNICANDFLKLLTEDRKG
jgi:hypothetical protein